MAGAAGRPHRRRLHGPAARGDAGVDAGEPALLRAARTPDGRAAPYFVFVANIEPIDGGAAIIAGNERVLRARFADARHFWDLDRTRAAGKPGAEAGSRDLSRQARHPGRAGAADRRAWRRISPRWSRAGEALGRDARPSSARPISSPAWSASSRNCRASWAATTRCMTARIRSSPTRSATITRRKARATRCRCAPVSIAVALADKLDQLAGFFAIGERADRLGRSLRAAPRGTGRDPHHPRKRPAPGLLRADRGVASTRPEADPQGRASAVRLEAQRASPIGRCVPRRAAARPDARRRARATTCWLLCSRARPCADAQISTTIVLICSARTSALAELARSDRRRRQPTRRLSSRRQHPAHRGKQGRAARRRRRRDAARTAERGGTAKAVVSHHGLDCIDAMRAGESARPLDAFFEKVTVNAPDRTAPQSPADLARVDRMDASLISRRSRVSGQHARESRGSRPSRARSA